MRSERSKILMERRLETHLQQPTQFISADASEAGGKGSNAVVQSSGRRHKTPTTRSSFSQSYFFFKWLLNEIEKPWTPLNEVYPFPTRRKIRNGGKKSLTAKNSSYSPKALAWRMSESEARLCKMERLFPVDNPGLIAEMEDLANIYFDLGRYRQAESLYCRVAHVNRRTMGDEDPETLRICLQVIKTIRAQTKYLEAKKLHEDLHPKIIRLIDPWDELAVQSRVELAAIQYFRGNYKEAESIEREVLQIALNGFGPRHFITRVAMISLGKILMYRQQHFQTKQLLRAALQIESDLLEGPQQLFYIKSELGKVLCNQSRYRESISLLKDAVKWSTRSLEMEHPDTLMHIYRLTRSLRFQGKHLESEQLIRPNFWRTKELMGLTHPTTQGILEGLAYVLMQLGRWEEATIWHEELFRLRLERYGLEHDRTRNARDWLEYCYTMQGLYKDPSSLSAKLESVLSSKAGTIDTKKFARKYDQTKEGEEDEDEEELEEIQPWKKRRLMTCTFKLKGKSVEER
jgi:tetratricopeptide (TPR) repeat protein